MSHKGNRGSSPASSRSAGLHVPKALEGLLPYHLLIAQEASFNAVRKATREVDLQPGWYASLTVIADNPGLTPSKISRFCNRDRSTTTSTLKALSARGFIARQRKAHDNRSYGVMLTPAGRTMLRKLRVIARAHDAHVDAIVGADKPKFIAILRRIAEALSAPDEMSRAASRTGRKRVRLREAGKKTNRAPHNAKTGAKP